MEIRITDMSITDAARILEQLAAIGQDSMSHGDLPHDLYAGLFETMGGIATAIRQEAGCAA